MDTDKLRTMMHRARKGPISELNGCFTCQLCKGYFIDATTIIECLHTFCRSCIVRYLETNKYCPICDVQVHKTKPLLNIRRDKTIQDLVYKLVPRLYQNEAKRRTMFYEANPAAKLSLSEESTLSQYEYILAPEEAINITLNYYGCSSAPRYLRCPSAVSITHLKKLIQAKYELTDHHKVDVFYNQDILNSSYSLMDIAYINMWKKKEPLQLFYKIYECRAKKPKLDCTENGDGITNKSTNNNNNNNWKEVQLRISENGEMSITGIEDASMLELLDATENYKSDIVINESIQMDTYAKPVQDDTTNTGNNNKAINNSTDAPAASQPAEAKQDSCSAAAPGPVPEENNHLPATKKELPELKFIGKSPSNSSPPKPIIANTKLLNSGIKMVINNAKSAAKVKSNNNTAEPNKKSTLSIVVTSAVASTSAAIIAAISSAAASVPASKSSIGSTTPSRSSTPNMGFSSPMPKSLELSETLNLNSELSVIPLNPSVSCVSLSSCGGTTTVFSTISKSMCSTKSDDSYSRSGINDGMALGTTTDSQTEKGTNNISSKEPLGIQYPKEINNTLKRKCEEPDNKTAEVPAKLPKPTILNHSIGLMNLSNHHPLKKHSKMNRNGERRIASSELPISSPSLTVSHVVVSQKPAASLDNATPSKPVIINKNLSYLQLNRASSPKLKSAHSGNVPCYMPKVGLNSVATKAGEKNGEKLEAAQEKIEGPLLMHNTNSKTSTIHSHYHAYQNTHHTPIITPAQLPHHQNLNSLHQLLKSSSSSTLNTKDPAVLDKLDQENFQSNLQAATVSRTTTSSESKSSSSTVGLQFSQANSIHQSSTTGLAVGGEGVKGTREAAGSSTHKPTSDSNAESPLQAHANSTVSRSVVADGMTNNSAVPSTSGSASCTAQNLTVPTTPTILNCISTPIKSKPSTPIGYKTLRDPPKSWNSQINSQIARVNQNVKAQQQANAAAAMAAAASLGCGGPNAQGRFPGDLKSVRPAKFFKGRNMPRYLGCPASGVKPMYQVHVSPDKDKNQEQQGHNMKSEKSEIKKHSIVKIDPKTLKPISEKAPETSNLSNMSSSLGTAQNNHELRINSSPGDLKINISSVSIFNPLKLQQNSPKNERKSPKSPHSPKVKANLSTNSTTISTNTSSNSSSPISALSPKQQRDKNSLTFTPSNPFIPNLSSPTLNPNPFYCPAGGFPSYDPRFMAACHNLWYTQRMAAAAAAGLVPPPLPHALGFNIGLNAATTMGQQAHSPGLSPKHSTPAKATGGQPSPRSSSSNTVTGLKSTPSPVNKKAIKDPSAKNEKSLENALEKLTQSKAKELVAGNKHLSNDIKEVGGSWGGGGGGGSGKVRNNGSPLHLAAHQKLAQQVNTHGDVDGTHHQQQQQQQKKTPAKEMSALEKINLNKAIEILGNIRDGKRSPLVVHDEVRHSPAVVPMSGGSKSVPDGHHRAAAVKNIASGGRPMLPLTEQPSNLADSGTSLSLCKKDGQMLNTTKSSESAGCPKDAQHASLPIDKEQKTPAPDTKTSSSKHDENNSLLAPSAEIQRRLGLSEDVVQRQNVTLVAEQQGQSSDSSRSKNTLKTDNVSSKSAPSGGKLDETKSDDSVQKQSLTTNPSSLIVPCVNSNEKPDEMTSVEKDTRPSVNDAGKKINDLCRTTDNVANETSFSSVASGSKSDVSDTCTVSIVGTPTNQSERINVGGTSGNVAEKLLPVHSGGGETTSSSV